MNSTAPLTGSHLRTYNTIFQHPISHNLEWLDVHALLREIGQFEQEPDGKLKVTRNGQEIILPHPHGKDIASMEELMSLRHFLERSEIAPPATESKEMHWLLVIDHHMARIFSSAMHGSLARDLLPHPSHEYFRHAHNSKYFSKGMEKPEPNSFFEPVAKGLRDTGEILVFGPGKGSGSEMEQFVAWAKSHRPELAARIIGMQVVDEHHLTDGQLLAKAREFFAAPREALL